MPQRIKPPKDEDFVFGKMIGEGSFSCVFLARDASTQKGTPHQEYAIKVRVNDKLGEQEGESLSASIVTM